MSVCQSSGLTEIAGGSILAARSAQGAGNIKIVLKDQLKYVPIIGWGMRLFEFLFLRRSIDTDKTHIQSKTIALSLLWCSLCLTTLLQTI